jgi:putative ABC transport system ATP-binding protein
VTDKPDTTDLAAKPVVAMHNVEKTWASADRRFTLRIADFHLAAGEVVAVTGESGSGKSTFLELVGLVSRPDQADVFTMSHQSESADIMALHRQGDASRLAGLRARHIGFVLQTGGLLPFLTVADNVALAQELAGLARQAARAQCHAILARLDIAGTANALPGALSVGQRQRAAIARAMAHSPSLVLADEPTAALDPPNKDRVIDLFLHLAHDLGAAVIIATHEQALFAKRNIQQATITAQLSEGKADHVHAELHQDNRP